MRIVSGIEYVAQSSSRGGSVERFDERTVGGATFARGGWGGPYFFGVKVVPADCFCEVAGMRRVGLRAKTSVSERMRDEGIIVHASSPVETNNSI